jgi:hypothetical protein
LVYQVILFAFYLEEKKIMSNFAAILKKKRKLDEESV